MGRLDTFRKEAARWMACQGDTYSAAAPLWRSAGLMVEARGARPLSLFVMAFSFPLLLPRCWRVWWLRAIQNATGKSEHRLMVLCGVQRRPDDLWKRRSIWQADGRAMGPLGGLPWIGFFDRSFRKGNVIAALLTQVRHAAMEFLLKIPLHARDILRFHFIDVDGADWSGKHRSDRVVAHTLPPSSTASLRCQKRFTMCPGLPRV